MVDWSEQYRGLSQERRTAFALLLKKRGIDVLDVLPIQAVPRDETAPLSPAQERLWFLANLQPESAAYNIGEAILLRGKLDRAALEHALTELVRRHEVLRTSYESRDGKPVARVHAAVELALDSSALDDGLPADARRAMARELAECEAARPFDLGCAPLFRVRLCQLAGGPDIQEWLLLWTMHHIISDGWSMSSMIGEFAQLYAAYGRERPAPLPVCAIQYIDFAVWQREWLAGERGEKQLQFWLSELSDLPAALELPIDFQRGPALDTAGAVETRRLDFELSEALRVAARASGVTPFMFLLGAFELLLARLTGQSEFCIGLPIANRSRPELENVIGFFVNTVVVRARVAMAYTFAELLERVKSAMVNIQGNADVPFERVVERLRPERSLGRNPIFDVLFNYHLDTLRGLEGLPGLEVEVLPRGSRSAQFDLSLDISQDDSGRLALGFGYRTALFSRDTILRFATYFERILRRVVEQPQVRIGEVGMLDGSEQARLLDSALSAAVASAAVVSADARAIPQLVPAWLQASMAARGNREALVCGGERLTFDELWARSGVVADALLHAGLRPEQRVGVLVRRSTGLVVALIGVLRAGGAFVPLDPKYPSERLEFILNDSRIEYVITEGQSQIDRAPSVYRVSLETALHRELDWRALEGPVASVHPRQAAYVIYTSGSTGVPKGVVVEHGALAEHCAAIGAEFALDLTQSMLLFASVNFDAAIDQWLVPLLHGARVVMRGEEIWSFEQMYDTIVRERITVLNILPSYLLEFAGWAELQGHRLPLESCISGGEALPMNGVALCRRVLPTSARILNAYGPTETVVTPMVWHASSERVDQTGYAPIGRTLASRTGYILDSDLNLLPERSTGELFLGGSVLARGYQGRPGLTAERFIPDPFGAPGARLYRTGDRVRRRADGTVEYLGRTDHQVKLRGYRIELGEIEAELLQCPNVREACVLLLDAPKRLVGYVLTDGDVTSEPELRTSLAQRLPEYMVPARLVMLRSFPRTPNGKTDKPALRSLASTQGLAATPLGDQPEVELTDNQRTLLNIWRELLGVHAGVDDNFFELGGDSILTLQLVSRARGSGLMLRPRDVFAHQTVRGLSSVCEERTEQSRDVNPRASAGPLGLTPIQRAFFEQRLPKPDHFNQAVLLRASKRIDTSALRTALEAVLVGHDSLRLRFVEREGGIEQSYAEASPSVDDVLWQRSLSHANELEPLCDAAQASLCLRDGVLIRAVLARLPDGSDRLLIAVHHLAVDGVSFRILLEDLARVYGVALEGKPVEPIARTDSYREWSGRLEEYARSARVQAQIPFWQTVLAHCDGELPFPSGDAEMERADESSHAREPELVRCQVAAGLTQQLLREANAAYRTQIQDLLLAAFARAVGRLGAKSEFVIELEGHGREDLFDNLDVSRTVGWFTSIYPVHLPCQGDWKTVVTTIKGRLRAVPDRGLGFGALRYLEGTLAGAPRSRIAFNYLGQFDAVFGNPAEAFAPARESAGRDSARENPNEHWLEVNGQIFDGCLDLSFAFRPDRVPRSSVASLVAAFRQELESLLEHCLECPGAVTRSDFPLCSLDASELETLPVPPREIEDLYPLTPMQQGMLFHSLAARGAASQRALPDPYVNQSVFVVADLDVSRFENAWNQVIANHAVLRTRIVWEGLTDEPLQLVQRNVRLQIVGYSAQDRLDAERTLLRVCDDDRRELGFAVAPLMRVSVIAEVDGPFRIVWTCHHLMLDGWSSSRVIGEVIQQYVGVSSSRPRAEYRNYVAWLARRELASSEQFFRAELRKLSQPTLLASACTERGSGPHRVLTKRLTGASRQHIVRFCQRERVTLNTLVQGAWAILLARVTGQNVVALGSTVSGRPADLPNASEMVGMFINTLPLVVEMHPEQAPGDFLRDLQRRCVESREHEHTPLWVVQKLAPFATDHHGARGLFDTLVVVENYPLDRALSEHRGDLRILETRSSETTSYDMTLAVVDSGTNGGELTLNWDFSPEQYGPAWVERLAARFEALLLRLTRARAVGDCGLATDSEIDALTRAATRNEGEDERPAQRSTHLDVVSRLAEVARWRGDADAVVAGLERLSYSELARRAERIARRLVARGVQRESRVGVMLERSVDAIAALWGVWLAGAAYVPLDPAYPRERLEYMLADCGARVLLTREELALDLTLPAGVVTEWADARGADADLQLPDRDTLSARQLAYVIYTSGSSGRPKGVAVEHGALAMHCFAAGALYGMGESDAALHFASLSFDAAVEQWLVPLLHGAKLVLSQGLWTGEETRSVVLEEGITVIYPPTSYVTELARLVIGNSEQLPIRVVTVGGEAVPRETIDLLQRAFGAQWVINGYGPTESVITPLLWRASRTASVGTAYAPIGTAVGERSAYVLDSDGNLAPSDMPGELYIGGFGLARGYHERPSLTGSRFVPDPFGAPGSRLYRTGDTCRRLTDGTFEYLGRVDEQVKIRGFRVELGEIEAELLSHDGVTDARVILRETERGKQLCAYVVSDEAGLSVEQLGLALARRLPEHMRPSHIVRLEKLPRTPNGKIDIRALPQPEPVVREYRAVQTETERMLVEIWRSVLGVKEVGVQNNFFELGGDSILSIQIASRARRAALNISPRDVFEAQTVEELARRAEAAGRAVQCARGPLDVTLIDGAPFPLSPIQSDFFARGIPEQHHFNQSLMLRCGREIDLCALGRALQHLVSHHDALRLRFEMRGGPTTQHYAGSTVEPGAAGPGFARESQDLLWVNETSPEGLLELCQNVQRSLNLEAGPVLRAAHFKLPDGSARLLLVIHHLVVDAVSWRILIEDLGQAYAAFARGAEPDLPSETSSYAAFTVALERYANSETVASQLPYWRDVVSAVAASTVTCASRSARTKHVRLRVDARLTEALLRRAPVTYRTQIQELLLTALGRALRRLTGASALAVEIEGHGREEALLQLDLSRTVGWFTTLYPVVLPIAESIGECLMAIKETLRAVPHRGLGFGALTSYTQNPDLNQYVAQLRAAPRPSITFNYLGQFDNTFQVPSEEAALFSPAEEDSGDESSRDAPPTNAVVINARVYGGELEIGFICALDAQLAEHIEQLVEQYRRELEAIAAHCATAKPQWTPSDFALLAKTDHHSGLRADVNAHVTLTQANIDDLAERYPDLEDIWPLTPMQEGMLFHALEAAPGADPYLNQLHVSVVDLDVPRFVEVFRQVVAAHESLRVAFAWRGLPRPVQVVRRATQVSVEERWLGSDAELESTREREQLRGVDLEQGPLLRLVVARQPKGVTHLIWVNHHLVIDGWSSARLLEEVLGRYAGAESKPGRGRYRDYLSWLMQRDPRANERYFRALLAPLSAPTHLASALAGRPGGDGHGRLRWRASPQETLRLQAFLQQQRLTANSLIQGAWALLLSRYCGQEHVVFGITVSGRPAEVPFSEEALGLFINTVPVVTRVSSEMPIVDWLRTLIDQGAKSREHEHTPLYDVQRWSGCSGVPLFDSLLVFDNYPVGEVLEQGFGGLKIGATTNREHTNYPLTIGIEMGSDLVVSLDYSRSAVAEHAAEALLAQFSQLILTLAEDARRSVGQLGLPGGLITMDQPAKAGRHVLDALQEQVLYRGSSEAVICGETRVSFEELWRDAQVWAETLRALGVGAESRVGIAMERSARMLSGMLGVWLAGGACVPLDGTHPVERLAHIVEDAVIQWVISDEQTAKRVAPSLRRVEWLTDANREPSATTVGSESFDLATRLHWGLAYVIYTSGSTGKPKGVLVDHGALACHIDAVTDKYGYTEHDTALQFSSIQFDASLEQWLAPLSRGARVVLRGPDIWTASELLCAIELERITVIDLLPAYLRELAELALQKGRDLPVRLCVVGGEALPSATWKILDRVLEKSRLVNGYGPTEAIITPLTCELNPALRADDDDVRDCHFAPIGGPLPGRAAHVLDSDLNPVPCGIAGELYIGGASLARGYAGKAALTAERFLPDPFSTGGARLYRTGDRVRWLENGVVEYLGRTDDQIKVRGYRVELGEIEAVLTEHAAVREAAVCLRGSPERLVAYVVWSTALAGSRELLEYARARLPAYQVPTEIVPLPSLPRTPVGKLDRRALPDVLQTPRSHVEPRDDEERKMRDIWKRVLGIEELGVTENFFDLGGHSVLAIRLLSQVNGAFSGPPSHAPGAPREVRLSQLLAAPTSRELTELLSPEPVQRPRARSGWVPLNGSQAQAAPLFCFHAAGGSVFPYRKLAQWLESTCPVLGLPYALGAAETSLAQLAASYALQVSVAQPVGPYRLFGWSLGGALAALVAAELERTGYTIEFLGLADCYLDAFGDHDSSQDDAEIENSIRAARGEWMGALAEQQLVEHEIVESLAAQREIEARVRGSRLAPVKIRPDCYWSADVGRVGLSKVERELEHSLHTTVATSQRFDQDHRGLVESVELAKHVAERLKLEGSN
ncbi:MAG TPA: amino acid adenylation domain-containing protein [Polyangiaceae bacterium]|nr:amino acid adenylation domain-containing protein [Polyangiaceae bacterium]